MTALKAFVAAAVLACATASAVPVTAAPGPSFNCRRAHTFVEKAICTNPSLAARDRRMSRIYFDTLASYRESGDREAAADFQAEQRNWLARRNRCQTTVCLVRAYDRRIEQIEAAAY